MAKATQSTPAETDAPETDETEIAELTSEERIAKLEAEVLELRRIVLGKHVTG